MKIKLVIKDLNFLKKLKSDNNKNISRNFSGTVVHSVGSFQCQIVPCSHLYLFSRSIDPLQCPVNVNYRVFICCTCYFQSGSLFFILASSACKSLQCLISTLTQGGRGTLQTNITGVCRECSQYMDHTGFAPALGSTCFPVLHCSGSRILCKDTV